MTNVTERLKTFIAEYGRSVQMSGADEVLACSAQGTKLTITDLRLLERHVFDLEARLNVASYKLEDVQKVLKHDR